VFLAVAELGSLTLASERCHVSQPAVTQALTKLEREAGGALFERTRAGIFLSERGRLFEARIRRAMLRLDGALAGVSPRLPLTATTAQLRALVGMTEVQNYTLAARDLGLAQPTVHRAIAQIEREAARPMFERTSFGMVPTRACREIALAARLAFSEFQQAEVDLADFDGREVGQITLGALPLSRSVLLPAALAAFRARRPKLRVTVFDGPYGEMLGAVRRGDMDFMIGALRDPHPIEDIVQEKLFEDSLSVVARKGHPLTNMAQGKLGSLVQYPWVVPRSGTPSRLQFDAAFNRARLAPPDSILECGSILLMRELLSRSDMLGCISEHQAEAEVSNGLIIRLDADVSWTGRAIGLTYRKDWLPTKAQALLLDMIREAALKMRRGEERAATT